jgi:hypothetical protein
MVAIPSTNPINYNSKSVNSGQDPGSRGVIKNRQEAQSTKKNDPREDATTLAQEISELPKVQELKTMPIINSGVNTSKKVLANLFRLAGFVGASLSIASYFLFNLKSLALVFGIPTGMAFFIAHTLVKSVKNNQTTFSTNPVKILNEAVNKPDLLETDLNRVLYAVEHVKDMKNSDPLKPEGINAIETLNDIVDTRLEQLSLLENEADADNLALVSEYNRFKVAYNEMKDLESQQVALHKSTSV